MTKTLVVLSMAVAVGASGTVLGGRARPPDAQHAGKQSATPVPNPAELDQLLAPIALYPDALLGQMLLCAADPAKVSALSEWLRSYSGLKGTELQDAAKASGFEESFVAIALFPDVVDTMAERIDWTTKVGKAFLADRSAVFASIQRLRTKAREAGKLTTNAQQAVETRTTSGGEEVIVIEPANPQVVYVPQYNAQTVYTPAATSTTVVVKEESDTDAAVAAGLIGFTAGIAIGAAIDNDYYYGPYGWRGGVYMYDDAWDDWYDHREDAREDWMEHREDIVEDRGERARSTQDERTERQQTRQESRPEAQAEREQRRTNAQAGSPAATGAAATTAESRGYSRDAAGAGAERTGVRTDAFSGYSSGKSERAASSRGQHSRSSSRGSRRR